jgi:hypothetical protein
LEYPLQDKILSLLSGEPPAAATRWHLDFVGKEWMSRKRDVLEQLKRDELLAAVDRFDLPVQDRRGKAALVETLAGSRKTGIAAILEDLSRDRLKELCRARRVSGWRWAKRVAAVAGLALVVFGADRVAEMRGLLESRHRFAALLNEKTVMDLTSLSLTDASWRCGTS